MTSKMMNINGTLWMPKYEERSALWYVDIDGQAVSAESIEALEVKLRELGYTVYRYTVR